ncbi:MAG: hypothetical protein KAI99_16105, partial [Cyclobacteriaceae bacterium]|nr:hypothetical protein [Cyclobacteriaceae bacterium]
MPRLNKVKMVSEIERHISLVSENVNILPYLRKGNLKIMLDIVSYWSEEFSRLRIIIDRAEKEKKIEKRKRAEKKAKRLGLIKDKKG